MFGVPAALAHPSSQASIWRALFTRGKATMPKVAVLISLAFAYAAFDSSRRHGWAWKGFVASAVLMAANVPFTIIFMSSTNAAILDAAAQTGTEASGRQVSAHIKRWAVLNVLRSLLPLASTIIGAVTYQYGIV